MKLQPWWVILAVFLAFLVAIASPSFTMEKVWVEDCKVIDNAFQVIVLEKDGHRKNFFMTDRDYKRIYIGQIIDVRITENRDIIEFRTKKDVFWK